MTQTLSREMVAAVVDHTFLKTEKEGVSVTEQTHHVEQLVDEAIRCGAYSVCVREGLVSYARELIGRSKSLLRITSVIGFPDGNLFSTQEKLSLLKQAKLDGADEFDMVIRFRDVIAGKLHAVSDDVQAVSEAAAEMPLKVILENVYLTDAQKREACRAVVSAFEKSAGGAPRFLKTSTGFATSDVGKPVGATLEDVRLMREFAGNRYGIKPAGGVNSLPDASAFFEAAGAPWSVQSETVDPMRFRIGASGLLRNLFGSGEDLGTY